MKNVNILIYAEPAVFLEQLEIEKNINVFYRFISWIVKPLSSVKNRKYKFWIICNEYHCIDDGDIDLDVQLIRVTQRELTNNWKYEPFKLFEQWQTGQYSAETFEYYYNLLKTKISVKPNVIFSTFNAPFLKRLFEDVLYFSNFVGILSRAPYPFTTSFAFGDLSRHFECYTYEYWDLIKSQHQLTNSSKELITEFKLKCRNLLISKSPYKDLLEKYRKTFDYLYLLPLSVPFNPYIAQQKGYHSEFHFLLDVLDKSPDNLGIIVTTHPRLLNYLDENMINCLKKRYKNFLNDASFIRYLSASQFILPEVDGIIRISPTSLAMQAMIFDKKIISLGDNFFKGTCDSSSIMDFIYSLDKPAANRDDILFWYLTRYCLTSNYYLNGEWLDKFLMNSLEKFRNKDFENFYELIDEPEIIINHLIESLDENIPQLSDEPRSSDRDFLFRLRHHIPIEYNTEFFFKKDSIGTLFLVSGFSDPEQNHTWTIQEEAVIAFPISFLTETNLIIVIKGHLLAQNQTAEIMINDCSCGKIENFESEFRIKAADLSKQKYLKIGIITSNIYSPKEMGINDDTRTLGFALYSIRIYEETSISPPGQEVVEVVQL